MGELTGHSRSFSNWLIYSLNTGHLYSFKEAYIQNSDRKLLPYE